MLNKMIAVALGLLTGCMPNCAQVQVKTMHCHAVSQQADTVHLVCSEAPQTITPSTSMTVNVPIELTGGNNHAQAKD